MSPDPQQQIEQTRAEIEETREQLADDVEAIRERADLRARLRDGTRARADAAVEAGRRVRDGFRNGGGSATGPHRLGGAAREFGFAATAAGWRKKLANAAAPKAADATPATSDEARALLGLALFGISVYYLLGTLKRASRT